MASGGSSGRTSSGPRSFDFVSDDVLCAYDDYTNQDPSNGKRSDPSPKDFHESRIGRPLVSVYGQQNEYPKEEIIDAVEKCMKKYADNLLRQLDGISGRLSQLEIYCYKLERSIGEFRADMIRDQGQADTKLKSLGKHLQEVHRSIQVLRDKQELAETQKELTKLQLAPKESASPTQSQKREEAIAPSSVSEPKRHDDISDIPNQHLALALPHQIPPPTSLPTRAPDQNQLPMQPQQQQPPLPQQTAPASLAPQHYVSNQSVPFYPQHSQALQPEIQYMQPRPQIQDSTPTPPPSQQPQVVNQPQTLQPFPQYQQQWSQPPSQQFTQQVVVPTQQHSSQAQLSRPQTPPTYLSYTHQSANPEAFGYSSIPQSNGNRTEAMPFGYGGSGSTVSIPSQPQQHAGSQSSFGVAKASGYTSGAPYPPHSNVPGYSTVYSMDGSRVQSYQPGSYPAPSNVPGIQNQQLPPGNSGGFHHPGAQIMRSHPYADMIEKAASMGYPRDQVVGVVNRMADSGQPVDFNVLLDRLNSRPAAGGPPRAWSG